MLLRFVQQRRNRQGNSGTPDRVWGWGRSSFAGRRCTISTMCILFASLQQTIDCWGMPHTLHHSDGSRRRNLCNACPHFSCIHAPLLPHHARTNINFSRTIGHSGGSRSRNLSNAGCHPSHNPAPSLPYHACTCIVSPCTLDHSTGSRRRNLRNGGAHFLRNPSQLLPCHYYTCTASSRTDGSYQRRSGRSRRRNLCSGWHHAYRNPPPGLPCHHRICTPCPHILDRVWSWVASPVAGQLCT